MPQINSPSSSEIDQLRQELTEFHLVDALNKIKVEVSVGPSCFIAYAKGIDEHEAIIHKLAKHLKAAGLRVSVDIWDRRPGIRTSDFIGRLDKSDYVILAGSENLKEQYESYKEGKKEERKRISFAYQLDTYVQLEQVFNKLQERSGKIIPLLLEKEMSTAFPAFLQGITPLNMQNKKHYHYQLFELLQKLTEKDLSPFIEEFAKLQTALLLRNTSLSYLFLWVFY